MPAPISCKVIQWPWVPRCRANTQLMRAIEDNHRRSHPSHKTPGSISSKREQVKMLQSQHYVPHSVEDGRTHPNKICLVRAMVFGIRSQQRQGQGFAIVAGGNECNTCALHARTPPTYEAPWKSSPQEFCVFLGLKLKLWVSKLFHTSNSWLNHTCSLCCLLYLLQTAHVHPTPTLGRSPKS